MEITPDLSATAMIRIIGAALGRGAQDQRTEHAPDKLREAGLVAMLNHHGALATWDMTLYPHYGIEQAKPVPIVAEFCQRLMKAVKGSIRAGDFPLVVGGDHSCAIGTWSGVYQAMHEHGDLGLIWIDAHMDSHTHETTPSGAVHGMPLASLLGYGDEELVQLGGLSPKLLPQNVCLIGIRSYEEGEAALLHRLGVRVFLMEEIMERGIVAVLDDALHIVQSNTFGFGISLDIDAVDPSDAPGVGSRATGGMSGAELTSAFRILHNNPQFLAMEITEFNPFLDEEDKTLLLAVDMLSAALGGAQSPA